MTTNHTPGPWEKLPIRGNCLIDPADYKLMLQAPALLAALEGLLNHEGSPLDVPHKGHCRSFVIPSDLIKTARTVIAQARGETR